MEEEIEGGSESGEESSQEEITVRGETTPIPSEMSEEDFVVLFGKYKVRRCIALTYETNTRCTMPAVKGNSYCKHHSTSLQENIDLADTNLPRKVVSLPSDFQKELRALRKFLIDLTSITETPKVLNRVNDLIEVVERLEAKVKANVTKQQIQQLGFYFASILFKYIPDGQRYEEAKKEFIDAVLRAGAYDQSELDSVIKSSSEVKLYESV